MVKPLIWIGAVLAVLGGAALALFVVPYVGLPATGEGLTPRSPMATLLAVLAGGVGLAAGFALIGVGIGRWQRPTHSHTLPLGQTRNSSEV